MRHTMLAIACLTACAAGAAHADSAKSHELSSHECGFSTPYNLQVDDNGVRLYRHDGTPKDIFFHDGALSVDHRAQAVGAADAQRLRQMEDGTRALMPEVVGIARESVGITFDALASVTRTMTGSERKARKIERYREHALEQIDDSLGKGRWDQDVFEEKFEANVEQVAEEVAHSISRSVLWAVFTGRAGTIDKRADRVDQEMDKLVEARTAQIESHARALCTRVDALRQLQDAMDYRYNGTPLAMLEPSDTSDAQGASAQETTAKVDVADSDGGK